MRRVVEATRLYQVVRVHETDIEWLVDMETVEEVEMTWTEFMKYVKKHYELKSTKKTAGYAVVA